MSMKAFDIAYPRAGQARSGHLVDGFNQSVGTLIGAYGGCSFGDGIYRVLTAEEVRRWTETVRRFFPQESSHAEIFSADWQGNMFGYRGGASPCVLLFQPGTGDVYEVEESIESFHNLELVEHAEEALGESLWKSWCSKSPAPTADQCVAYIRPVFLGGDVVIGNLVLTDLEVYWEVTGQLLQRVRGLPAGTPIRQVNLSYLDNET